jgi:HAD superfamily hydrolase (TIGR01509 family)
MTRPGVLLDIDGTLLDTNHLHVLAWWRAFRRVGETVPMHRIHALIGMGGDQLVPEAIGHESSDAEDAYGEEFDRLADDGIALLPGAREMVERMADAGLVCVLASSAREQDVKRFRELLDIDRWVAGATSSGDADDSKPAPDIFGVAMERHDLAPETTIVLGDTVWDGHAAARAGTTFVAVETGGIAVTDLRGAGAADVYPDPQAVADDLERGPFARLLG